MNVFSIVLKVAQFRIFLCANGHVTTLIIKRNSRFLLNISISLNRLHSCKIPLKYKAIIGTKILTCQDPSNKDSNQKSL